MILDAKNALSIETQIHSKTENSIAGTVAEKVVVAAILGGWVENNKEAMYTVTLCMFE